MSNDAHSLPDMRRAVNTLLAHRYASRSPPHVHYMLQHEHTVYQVRSSSSNVCGGDCTIGAHVQFASSCTRSSMANLPWACIKRCLCLRAFQQHHTLPTSPPSLCQPCRNTFSSPRRFSRMAKSHSLWMPTIPKSSLSSGSRQVLSKPSSFIVPYVFSS
jgi:hypothetical protein